MKSELAGKAGRERLTSPAPVYDAEGAVGFRMRIAPAGTRFGLTLFLLLLMPFPLQAGWSGAQDNKSVAELKAMTPDQLVNEGADACLQRALSKDTAADATDYLNTIYPIARAQNGGVTPTWMIELSTAQTAEECRRAFSRFIESEAPAPPTHRPPRPARARRPKRRVAATRPTPVPEAAPTRPAGGISEQLPPWLAPR